MPVQLTPAAPEIGPSEGFTADNDIFGYKDFGERMANVITGMEGGLTTILDGPWGHGKSTFARQWAGLLRQRGCTVIEFDAFAKDYQEDAFLALAAEVVRCTEEIVPDTVSDDFKGAAKRTALILAKHAAGAGLRVATWGLLGGEFTDNIIRALADKAGGAVEDLIGGVEGEEKAFEAFRKTLTALTKFLAERDATELTEPKPLVIIVDELDRCRPPFALQLLERIKHFYSVPGVVFVLVTNMDQLDKAVRGAYGQGTDGRTYLEKFYTLRITLPQHNEPTQRQTARYIRHQWDAMGITSGSNVEDEVIRDLLITLSEAKALSLRTVERVLTHVALSCLAAQGQQNKFAPLIAGLAVMRQSDQALYQKARAGTLAWAEVRPFFNIEPQSERENKGWDKMWRYATDQNMDQVQINDFAFLQEPDRFALTITVCEWIDGFHMPQDA